MLTRETERKPPLLVRAAVPAPAAPPGGVEGWAVLAGVGTALALVGWTDVLLGLFPVRIGNPDWEFGALSSAIDALPLGTLGLGLVTAAAAARARRRTLGALAVAAWLVAVSLVGALGLYLLSAPEVWRAVAPAAHGQLAIAMGKAAALALTYLMLYGWLGFYAIRAFRRAGAR